MGVIPFLAPFTMIVSGPTSCGKSSWVFKLLKFRSTMISIHPKEVIYALPEGQKISIPEDVKCDSTIKFVHGIPKVDQFKDKMHRLLIIDDQAADCGDEVVTLFTRLSHHFNISVILLTQNIFLPNPGFRTMSLNAHYIIIFKSPRSMDQITCLARQICPGNVKFFQESYQDCSNAPYSYFLLDMTQKCPEKLRFRSNIFPCDKNCTTIYLPSTTSLKKYK